MNKILPICLVFAVLVVACNNKTGNYKVKIKPKPFLESDIYDKEKVYDFIFDNEENDVDSLKKQSRVKFLEAINVYKNKKQELEAIPLFKEAILIFPDAKAYYELGNALLDAKYYNIALKAYQVAEYLNFQPLGNLYFNKACAYAKNVDQENARKKDGDDYRYISHQALGALSDAFANGFADTIRLKSDSRLANLRTKSGFKNLYYKYFINKTNTNESPLLGSFKLSFPDKALPYEITLNEVGTYNNKESISYDYAEFIPEMENTDFGREVSHDFYYTAKLAETDNYIGLVYSSVNFSGDLMQPVVSMFVTYDKYGSVISKKLFACQCSAEKVKTGKFENDIITITEYKRIWKEDITKIPFEENTIERHDLIATASYKIDESGKINEDNVPDNFEEVIVNDNTVPAKTQN